MKNRILLILAAISIISCNQLSEEELRVHNQKVTSGIQKKKNDLNNIIDGIKAQSKQLQEKYNDAKSFKLLRSSSTKKAQLAALEKKGKELFRFHQNIEKYKDRLDALHKTFDFQSKPENVLEKLFNAASSKYLNNLVYLVDPYDENDKDVDRISYIEAYPPKYKQDFYDTFKHGRIIGEPIIKENKAKIEFLFGPNGSRKETMNLIKRNESWYLSSY